MLRKTLYTVATIAGLMLVSSTFASAQGDPSATPETGVASVNGVEMYYEIHGSGEPLILIHGGLGGIVEFSQLLPALAESRQVIAVELQAHGHTADIDRPLSFEVMADDIAALIQHLGYERADVLGYSLGGGVALRTAIQHPEVVDRLILVSTPFRRESIHPEFRAGMEAMSAEAAMQMLETPMYQYYASVAPQVENWAALVQKEADLLGQDYDWSDEVAAMTTPTLILVGDNDFIPPSHAVEMYQLLGGGVAGGLAQPPASQFAVLPNTIHFNILYRTDLLLPIINPFLDPQPQQAN
jgi:pimeloyl-ACP methyl ester carboxylesterase